MGSEYKTQEEGTKLQTKRAIKASRTIRKRSFVQPLKKSQGSRSKNAEVNQKPLLNKSFIGNLQHDKLNINVHNMIKATNNYTAMSKKLNSEQLELQQACKHLEKKKKKVKRRMQWNQKSTPRKHRFVNRTKL